MGGRPRRACMKFAVGAHYDLSRLSKRCAFFRAGRGMHFSNSRAHLPSAVRKYRCGSPPKPPPTASPFSLPLSSFLVHPLIHYTKGCTKFRIMLDFFDPRVARPLRFEANTATVCQTASCRRLVSRRPKAQRERENEIYHYICVGACCCSWASSNRLWRRGLCSGDLCHARGRVRRP